MCVCFSFVCPGVLPGVIEPSDELMAGLSVAAANMNTIAFEEKKHEHEAGAGFEEKKHEHVAGAGKEEKAGSSVKGKIM